MTNFLSICLLMWCFLFDTVNLISRHFIWLIAVATNGHRIYILANASSMHFTKSCVRIGSYCLSSLSKTCCNLCFNFILALPNHFYLYFLWNFAMDAVISIPSITSVSPSPIKEFCFVLLFVLIVMMSTNLLPYSYVIYGYV